MAKIAVFDLDGTLVDTAPDLTASLNHCLSSAGEPVLTLEEVRPHAGHGARAMLAHAYARSGRTLPDAEMDRQLARFLAYYRDHICDLSHPFEGMVDALDRLRAAGWTLAVCTNKTEEFAVRLLDALGLSLRFAAICGADTFAQRKPDPSHLLQTIERAGARRENAVMTGDTATDIETAVAAGVPSVLVDFGYGASPEAVLKASRTIAAFEDLTPPMLDGLLGESAAPRLAADAADPRSR